MGLPARELPDEPAVHRSEEQLSVFGASAEGSVLIQQPFQLRAGEIGVDDQPGLLLNIRAEAVPFQPLADIRRSAALPADGVPHRFPGGLLPEDGGLPLVRDADAGDVRGAEPAFFKDLRHGPKLPGQDLHWVMLHPAGPGIDLSQGVLRLPHGVPHAVKEDGAGAGSPLIQRQNVFIHTKVFLSGKTVYTAYIQYTTQVLSP